MVRDGTWGGETDGRLSPTSRAMVDASDVIVAIGGGAIAHDELDEARRKGKTVRFHDADYPLWKSAPNVGDHELSLGQLRSSF